MRSLVAVAFMSFLLGCVPRTTSLRFVNDELDRIAITHNQTFRPTYKECQSALNELEDRLIEVPPKENVMDIRAVKAKGKLSLCSERLEDAYKDLGPQVQDFKKAVRQLP